MAKVCRGGLHLRRSHCRIGALHCSAFCCLVQDIRPWSSSPVNTVNTDAGLSEWHTFRGMCGTLGGGTVPVPFEEMDEASDVHGCHAACEARGSCAAFSVEQDGMCLLMRTCPRELAMSSGPRTFIKPALEELELADSGQDQTETKASDCSFCPPPDPCHQPMVCRFGRCFQGVAHPNGEPCLGDRKSPGTCFKGRCLVQDVDVDDDTGQNPTTQRNSQQPSWGEREGIEPGGWVFPSPY